MIDVLKINDISEDWRQFIEDVNKNPTSRKITMEAWKRCKDLGLESKKVRFKFLTDSELSKKQNDNTQLIWTSKLYMDSLSLSLKGIPHMVALSDKEGWIIDYRGTPEKLGGRGNGLCLGANWSERNIGNNGIGTALATGEPGLIYGVEHYGMIYGGCACVGVPIKYNGEIIGALDVSVPVQYAHPARLHILIACVNSIETTLTNINEPITKYPNDGKLLVTTELIGTAVHDLKNPLAVIRGLGQLGAITSDISKIHDYFERIIKQVDEMNSIVIDLLSIFRPEQLIPHKVSSIIEEVIYSFEPICNSKKIALSLTNNGDGYVRMSEHLFKRTIENLINNAVQIMDDGGIIRIVTSIEKESVLISIADNAGGVPEEIRDTLFEPFTFRRSGGTGLGLFMAYHSITNTLNGQIWFETDIGRGTTFFIRLPIVDENDYTELKQYQLA